MARLRMGSCSWKYPSWAGLVYSRAEGIDYLAEYARKYSTVEVDQWFWTLKPSPSDVERYRAAVPEDFRFTVKAPNALTLALTPGKKGAEPVPNPRFLSIAVLGEFLAALEPLRPQVGMVMFQFGYLNRKMMASPAVFLEKLDRFLSEAPAGWPYAVEIRNANWLGLPFFELLRVRHASTVLVQGYWMPPVAEVYDLAAELLEGPVVVRLHGPDRAGMEEKTGGTWDRIVEPRDAELGSVAAMVRRMLKGGHDVFLNVNNHYEGSAPLTIDRISALGLADGEAVDEG
ncbi:MAG: hypothetical protein A2177_04640 [Spirochaetes bacterium RBG_13_68_11]|nr:MAG: hypothetical protein A2177_04640 [Spirochaetes bacterium RBG_13_68_11]